MSISLKDIRSDVIVYLHSNSSYFLFSSAASERITLKRRLVSIMSINVTFSPQNVTNTTTVEFSCMMSNLSQSVITNDSVWSLSNNLLYDTPLVATVKLLVFLLTLVTCLLVVSFSYKKNKNPFTAVVVNMAIADILCSVTLLIFAISPEMVQRFAFGGNDFTRCGVCAFAGFLLIFFSSVSLHTYAVFIFERTHFLVYVFQARWWKKKWAKIVLILLVWFVSFWIAISPVMGFGQLSFDRDFGACIPRLDGMSMAGIQNRSYVGFLFIESLLLVGLILVCSIIVMKSTAKVFRSRSKRQRIIETLLTLLSSIIPWIPIAIITIVIIAVSPSSVSKEVYISCWLCYISNPVFRIPEYALFLNFDF